MDLRLKGKVAVVTGGSLGIGRAVAEAFAAEGVRVAIVARSQGALEEAAREITAKTGVEVLATPADVSDTAQVQAAVDKAAAHFGRIDILVNNAGAAWGEDFDAFPESGWDKVVDLNLKTPFFLTKALAGPLRAAARARVAKIINIASTDGIGLNPQENYSYVASKAGVIHLTRRMAMRLAQDNIAVSAIAPGAFPSEMNRNARDHGPALSEHIPARRIGTPDDIAGAAIFLASRAGDYVMGATLVVDGGVTQARAYR